MSWLGAPNNKSMGPSWRPSVKRQNDISLENLGSVKYKEPCELLSCLMKRHQLSAIQVQVMQQSSSNCNSSPRRQYENSYIVKEFRFNRPTLLLWSRRCTVC